jgi:selenophosphate synthetase-related protein
MALIWTVVQDLFFGEALGSGLARLGHEAVILDASDPGTTQGEPPPGAVALIADLEAGELALQAIRGAKAAGIPILAFGPHVDLDLRERALAAGAGQVVAKSKLTRSFPALVAQLLGESTD